MFKGVLASVSKCVCAFESVHLESERVCASCAMWLSTCLNLISESASLSLCEE